MDKQHQADDNKRQCIRIRDKILLSFRELSEEEYKGRIDEYINGSDVPWSDSYHPSIQRGIKKHLKRIREKDKDLAAVLEIFDQKLNLILGLINVEDSIEHYKFPSKLYKVDLSARGVGFVTDKSVSSGTILEMFIGLLPQHYIFNCFGRVVRSESKDGKNFVAVEFIWITEDDQEKIIEHIFGRQVLQLRMRRNKKG